MCLVSYVPTKNGYVFSSNRDEAPERSAKAINSDIIKGKEIFYPADVMGGSWIFASNKGDIICLLNGAFTIHERKEYYRMSRGLMLKAYFDYDNPVDFIAQFNLTGIEPFTCIILNDQYFFEYVWDGNVKYIRRLDRNKAHQWSSCTLYTPEVQQERAMLFKNKLASTPVISAETISDIHLDYDQRNIENGFVMNRNDYVKTISLTQVECVRGKSFMRHTDLIRGEQFLRQLTHNNN